VSETLPMKLFVHVEEPSMKEVVDIIAPKIIGDIEFKVIDHGSKMTLLRDLPNRLEGYKKRYLENIRVIVLIDRDQDNCIALKARLEDICANVGFATKSSRDMRGAFTIVNRIVIEELEAWFFGDIPAMTAIFPKVPATLSRRAQYRDPDAIKGGTWETLLRVLNKVGYYRGMERLPKIDVARRIAAHMSLTENTSASFNLFVSGLRYLVNQDA
jgi:hypothetical protein